MTRLRLAAVAASLVFAASPLLGGDYSTYIKLTGPADKARVTFDRDDEKVTLGFQMDLLALGSLARADGSLGVCSLRPAFFVICQGAGCRTGAAGRIDRTFPDTSYAWDMKTSEFLALTTGGAGEHSFHWGAAAWIAENLKASPPCPGIGIAQADRSFTLARVTPTPTPGPPDLAVSLDIDNPAVWPGKILVTDRGGPSKPTFLTVSFKTLSASDASVKSYCSLLDVEKTHTVLEMKHGDSRSFDVPALPASLARQQALPKALVPPTPAPSPTKGPPKAALQPGLTFHDPNVHQVVTCQYKLEAKLGSDTNAKDSDKQNNTLSRTIRIDAPMN